MQINCPKCQTSYDVPEAVFGGRARKLRCAQCGTDWRVEPPAPQGAAPSRPEVENAAPAPAPVAARAPAPAPRPEPPAAFSQFMRPPTAQPTAAQVATPTLTPPPAFSPPPAPAQPSISALPPMPASAPPPVSLPPAAAPTPGPGFPPAAVPAPLSATPPMTLAQRETVLSTDPYDDVLETDAFASLVQAARNRALEFEPELPPPSVLAISNPMLFGTLLVAFIAAFVLLERHVL